MRINLERIQEGKHPNRIVIGTLTQIQLAAINARKLEQELPPIIEEVVFIGRHIYKSRIEQDGYSIEDVLDQISSGMESGSTIVKKRQYDGNEESNKTARSVWQPCE